MSRDVRTEQQVIAEVAHIIEPLNGSTKALAVVPVSLVRELLALVERLTREKEAICGDDDQLVRQIARADWPKESQPDEEPPEWFLDALAAAAVNGRMAGEVATAADYRARVQALSHLRREVEAVEAEMQVFARGGMNWTIQETGVTIPQIVGGWADRLTRARSHVQ